MSLSNQLLISLLKILNLFTSEDTRALYVRCEPGIERPRQVNFHCTQTYPDGATITIGVRMTQPPENL